MVVVLGLSACSEGLQWRQVQPDGWGLQAALPCRPSTLERILPVGDREVTWTVWTCESDGLRFALASGDVKDPLAVTQALRTLVGGAAGRLGAAVEVLGPSEVPGATPSPAAVRYRWASGTAGQGQTGVMGAVFAHGTRIYQVQAIGEGLTDERVAPLLAPLRVVQR